VTDVTDLRRRRMCFGANDHIVFVAATTLCIDHAIALAGVLEVPLQVVIFEVKEIENVGIF
jgi:hypothetical protein